MASYPCLPAPPGPNYQERVPLALYYCTLQHLLHRPGERMVNAGARLAHAHVRLRVRTRISAYPNTSFLFSGTSSPSSKSENSLFLSAVSAAPAPVVILYYCKCLRAGERPCARRTIKVARAPGICARWGNREIQSEDQRRAALHLLHHEEDLGARAVTNTARNAFSFVLAVQRARQQARTVPGVVKTPSRIPLSASLLPIRYRFPNIGAVNYTKHCTVTKRGARSVR